MGHVQINGQTGPEHKHMTKFTGIYRLDAAIISEFFGICGACYSGASALLVWQT